MMNSPIPPPGARALILGRFSSDLQNPLSADDQIAACKKACEKLGWPVPKTFKDEAKSGRSVAKRTGYLDMMAAAEAGEGDVIVVTALDRIGRNARELHDAHARLSDADVVIYTLERGVMTRLEFAIYAEMAQMESEKIGERVSRGHRAAVARGKVMGDHAYGYKVTVDENGKRVEIDPVTAPIVLRINRDYAAGLSAVQIAKVLTAEGIPTPEGLSVWSPNTILGSRRSGNGLLRNPLYNGQNTFGKTRVRLDPKTGKFVKTKANAEDIIVSDVPWLRILPDELWHQVQDRLNSRSFITPNRNRHPDYLLSGLTKCGVCGGAFAMTTAKLGCVNLKVGACDNRRRVVRKDLERLVLEGLQGRLAQSHIIEWFMPEYLRESAQAAQETIDKQARHRLRVEEVDREIANVLKQVRSGASGYASKLLNENLESLGLEKERLARDARATKPTIVAPTDTEAMVKTLHALLDDLGTALQGGERDAAWARDIIRSFIHRVVVTPLVPEGRPDKRGIGPVRITVEGAISTLVDQALLEGKTLHSRSAVAVQGPPIATFRYYVDMTREISAEQEGIYADMAVVARLFEDSNYPIFFKDMVAALNDLRREPTDREREVLERRARIARAGLRRNKWIRTIGLGAEASWVWSERGISDDEWLRRLRHPGDLGPSIGLIRVTAPEAFVVVVSNAPGGLSAPPDNAG